MKNTLPTLLLLMGLGAGTLFLQACSSQSKSLTSKAYHNTTAHYNAYFIAYEKVLEVESAIKVAHKNNFNALLYVFPPLDTVLIKTKKEQLDDAYKKASLAIQRHQNSKWVDDSYILIGKVRYYQGQFSEAIETFKYVNKTSENPDAKHEALAYLIMAFTEAKEFNNASAVVDYLAKQNLSKVNQKRFALSAAHLYQKQGSIDKMAKYLIIAAPLMQKKEGRAKIYYIIGQIYQQLYFDAIAYENYEQCIRSNPDYELFFYARLNMSQVKVLSKTNDAKRIRKYYKKLLKDSKNKEFKDKIYYEMAEFEFKLNKLDEAISYYQQSIFWSTTNKRQQGYSYLKIGKIYYDSLKDYPMAKAYYDSTIVALPTDEPIYPAVKKRQSVLADFVLQLETIQLQDSLLQLAQLDSAQLDLVFSAIIKSTDEKNKLAQEREKRKSTNAARTESTSLAGAFVGGEGGWYFYSSNAISAGSTEFRRKWGDRPLQDNWRNSTLTKGSLAEIPKNNGPNNNENTNTVAEIVDPVIEQKKEYYSAIPFSEDTKKEANFKLEEAYFRLGTIYYFDLEEKNNAAISFETLLKRYPKSSHKPEVLYQLYLLYKDQNNPRWEAIKDLLIAEFPNAIYTKLITNPNYQEESQSALEQTRLEYAQAFLLYEKEYYDSAKTTIKNALETYAENNFTDNLRLLKVLITGRTGDYYTYVYELNQFLEENPDSELVDYTKRLIAAAEKVKEDQAKAQTNIYYTDFDQVHYGVILYEKDPQLADILPERLTGFLRGQIPEVKITVGSLLFDDQYSMILINEFPTKELATKAFQVLKSDNSPISEIPSSKIHNFVITKDNFQLFYQSKNISSYQSFFDKNYR